ncbi:MAG TPA: hypothetical protein H9671_07315 [Firmicutes bacterium]|nr:hypothetical protein [Bacillota bacterium]
MRYCPNCRVSVKEPAVKCPLCNASLAQTDGPVCTPAYPVLEDPLKRYNLPIRIALFASVLVGIVCLIVNWLIPSGIFWAAIVIGGLIYGWLTFRFAMRERYNIGLNILFQTVLISVLVIWLDFQIGFSNWSLNIAVPILTAAATLAISVIIIIRKMDLRSYVIYLIANGVLGLIPFLLLCLQVVTLRWPATASAGISVAALLGTLIFADAGTKTEIKKRLHL